MKLFALDVCWNSTPPTMLYIFKVIPHQSCNIAVISGLEHLNFLLYSIDSSKSFTQLCKQLFIFNRNEKLQTYRYCHVKCSDMLPSHSLCKEVRFIQTASQEFQICRTYSRRVAFLIAMIINKVFHPLSILYILIICTYHLLLGR